ncbi:MAG TPA: hypothetical protein PKD61_03230, partial [Polyangiaceae bacterium]|nr:hypothetical protein [Polyangiaceae bacterium]
MSLREDVYARSPHWLRDAMVSAVGYQFVRQRYTGVYHALRGMYDGKQQQTEVQQRAEQDANVRELVRYARANSPFYAELYAGCPEVSGADELKQLPPLQKEPLRTNLKRLRTAQQTGDLVSIHTSGTTGTPMEFFFFRADFQARMAILDSWRAWFGAEHGMRRATFSGRIVKPPSDNTRQFWQTNYALRQRLYSSYHLSSENLDLYVKNLNRFRPQFLDGYPSALHLVARHILARKISLQFRPNVIFTTAETLTAFAREEIQAAFGATVRDQYASSEGAPFIVECEAGSYHFLTYSGVLEVVDDIGRPATRGRALFTAFHTRFMPLIRYDIGDDVELDVGGQRCDCGRRFPVVRRLIGREEDYLVSSERGRIGRLDP